MWAADLKQVGVYYEGTVDSAEPLIEQCKLETVMTFGTRTSRQYGHETNDKQCSPEKKGKQGQR